MGRAIRKFRPKVPSSAVALESLERRQVLSTTLAPALPSPALDILSGLGADGPTRDASPQGRITITPGDGAALTALNAPTVIVAHMDAAVLSSWRNDDIALYKVADQGQITPIFESGQTPVAIKDRENGTVTIPLGGALAPGRYRVALAGGADTFSQLIHNGSWDYMEDQTLAEFEVLEPDAGFDSAIDAGTVGGDIESFTGALAAPDERALYRITLGSGQSLWRLGLQLDAQRIDSRLLATLTVYDARGNLVATSEGQRGLASAADDPYLFLGLQPGTYFVGVSMAEGSRSSGAYHLAIVADPAAPTRVTGFALDRTRGAPTGFTITFSDAISPEALAAGGTSLFAVDERGGLHSATLASADGGLRRLSFVFDQPIPAGRYQLVMSSEGGLADLIGRAPMADGQPAGQLASWTVSAQQASLGLPPPATPEQDWLDAASRESLIDNAVGPGGALGLRFGVGTGVTEPSRPGTVAVAGLSPTFIGVLDTDLVGRPAARKDGVANVGPIPSQGRLLLASVARDRLSGRAPAPSPADDGLARSPNGMPEAVRPGPSPIVEPGAPRLVEFPREPRDKMFDDGAQADADILERIENDRFAAASSDLARWLFGSPDRDGGDRPAPDQADAQSLADNDIGQPPRSDGSPDGRSEGGVSRAGLGVPFGIILGVAVAYRLHRRPPRWWRRRRPVDKMEAALRRLAVPRGPRHMVPPRPNFQRGDARRQSILQ